jgi:long-chain acyl-CoA synthetase
MGYACKVERSSIADYLPDFTRLGRETAFAEPNGYRIVRSTYRDVADAAYRFARELGARKIRKGDRVVLWGPNSAAWVAAFFGCAHRGVIVVPMDYAASPDFVLRVFQQVNARLILCSRDHGSRDRALPDLPSIFFEDLPESLARHSAAAFAPENFIREDALEIVFTSGTTAEPKGVVITHGNVLANIAPLQEQIKRYLKYERLVHPVRFFNLLPLSHVFGQFLGMYLPPLLAGTVVFQETLKPAEVIKTIRRERVSVLVAVPRMLQSLKEKIERDLEDAGQIEGFRKRFISAKNKHFFRRWWIFCRIHRQFGWKFWAFISGGAALDRESEEFWGRLGFAVIQGYGLTETTSLISVNHPFSIGKGSIGKVITGREVRLAPDGEILVRGAGVASGYWIAGELHSVASDSDEGWYHTGDIGELDSEGNLFFKGRKKDVVVTPAGMNVYPEDLENALKAQTSVKDCVVIPFAVGGNAEACAVLLLRNQTGDDQADPARIVEAANQALAEYQRMRRWAVWSDEDFPRTSTQKPRRKEIAETAQKMLAGEASPAPDVPLSDLISRITKRTLTNPTDRASLDADLGLSSLDRVELLSALEDRYQIDLSETSFSAVNSVRDLQRILKGELPPRALYHYPAWVQRWPVTWIRFFIHYLLRPAVLVLGWPRIQGRESLHGLKGPVLVICNHIDDVDVGFVLTALPARFRHRLATAAGGEALEALRTSPPSRNFFLRIYDRMEWFLGVSLLNLFPLPREAGFRDSFAFAGESVDRGFSILVFPEGRHSTDGQMHPFRSGIGLLVKNLRIPVVPLRIDGLFALKQAGRRVARPYQVKVKIGAPVRFEADTDPATIAATLQARVEEL